MHIVIYIIEHKRLGLLQGKATGDKTIRRTEAAVANYACMLLPCSCGLAQVALMQEADSLFMPSVIQHMVVQHHEKFHLLTLLLKDFKEIFSMQF
jgi:hypothetical protein